MTTDAITLPDLSLDRGRVGNVYRRGWGAGAGRTVPEGAHVPPAATNTVDWDAIVQGLRLACLYFDTDDADVSEEIPYPRWPDGDPFPVAKVRAGYSAAVEAQQNAGHVQVSDAIAEIKRLREALEDIRSRSAMNLAMRSNTFELTARLGDIYQIADGALGQAADQ